MPIPARIRGCNYIFNFDFGPKRSWVDSDRHIPSESDNGLASWALHALRPGASADWVPMCLGIDPARVSDSHPNSADILLAISPGALDTQSPGVPRSPSPDKPWNPPNQSQIGSSTNYFLPAREPHNGPKHLIHKICT